MTATQKETVEKIMGDVPIEDVRNALLNEFRRRIICYKMIDETMKKKYGMSFGEFEAQHVVRERDFSWPVESDAMEWEHAVEGIRYAEQKIQDLSRL